LLLGLALAGGASADEVVKMYQDPAFDGSVSNVLVVGIHADSNVRIQFENAVVRALRTAGATGDASIARMGSAQEITPATLVAAARRADADAVLITRVASVETHDADATTTFVEYFRAYASHQDPLPVVTTHTVVVKTDLFVVASQARVWGVESTSFEEASLFGVIDGIAQSVTSQLRADGLIGRNAVRGGVQ
jgi:hypothetical protein